MNKKYLDTAHELWSAAQLVPGDGIEDGVRRIANILIDIDAERGKEAVAWIDTLDTPHPRCVTNLDYRSLAEVEAGVAYIPLYLAPVIPAGYALVPVEPTEGMLKAFHTSIKLWLNEEGEDKDVYQAMLAAAKEPK